jgi:cell division protein FtsB
MRTLLTYLPVVGCLAMMLIVCGPMMFRRNKGAANGYDQQPEAAAHTDEVAQLREEVAMLRAQISKVDAMHA